MILDSEEIRKLMSWMAEEEASDFIKKNILNSCEKKDNYFLFDLDVVKEREKE